METPSMHGRVPNSEGCSARLLLTLLAALLLTACATHSLPRSEIEPVPSYAMAPANDGGAHRLAEQVTAKLGPDESAFLPLAENPEALRLRLQLADVAQQSIDLQYYLWNGDESGDLLGLRLLNAADRGVRIRLLVDDVFMLDSDDDIAILDSHPNIEVRIFNPWEKRGSLLQRGLEFLGNLNRLNQRMHNKLFVVDNRVAIVGGRNIGNAYFGFGDRYNFRDLELLCVGPVAEEISNSFDLYWNDEWVVPGAAFARPGRPLPALETIRRELNEELAESEKVNGAGMVRQGTGSQTSLQRLAELSSSGPVWVVYDDPPSVVLREEGVRKVEKLEDLDSDISKELLIASAYFIPTEKFLEKLSRLTQRGIRVRVITNSLASTNHTIVNSGYRPWRRKLIQAGVELYEYRGVADSTAGAVAPGTHSHRLTLHTKTFVIDREYVYVGSLNMDPRSFHINTEMGLLVYDQDLAGQVAALIEHDMEPANAWRVELDERGRLSWHSAAGVVYRQPANHFGQRIADFFYGLLPIEGQL